MSFFLLRRSGVDGVASCSSISYSSSSSSIPSSSSSSSSSLPFSTPWPPLWSHRNGDDEFTADDDEEEEEDCVGRPRTAGGQDPFLPGCGRDCSGGGLGLKRARKSTSGSEDRSCCCCWRISGTEFPGEERRYIPGRRPLADDRGLALTHCADDAAIAAPSAPSLPPLLLRSTFFCGASAWDGQVIGDAGSDRQETKLPSSASLPAPSPPPQFLIFLAPLSKDNILDDVHSLPLALLFLSCLSLFKGITGNFDESDGRRGRVQSRPHGTCNAAKSRIHYFAANL